MSDSIRTGSLVLYKSHPALVAGVADKIEIKLQAGKNKRVRPKDIVLLHPGPASSFAALDAGEGNVEEAWELLEGEQATLVELAELLYDEFTPAAAWGAWQLLHEGLYFEGELDNIRCRSAEAMAAEQEARDAKAREAREWDAFIERVGKADLQDSDRKRLAEVERVALGAAEHSRILGKFDVAETPEAAHKFLLRCGYWTMAENPWPRRESMLLAPVEIGVPALPDEPRLDLTHLEAWAIDDVGNQDPDDAISLDGDRLWVHVADVAALVRPGGHLDLAARERGANLYLPENIHAMLPPQITERLGLGLNEESPALSFGFRFDGEAISDIEIKPSRVRVTRTTYDDVNEQMDHPAFSQIAQITNAYRARRVANNAARLDMPEVSVRVVEGEVVIRPLPKLPSRDMVTDAMLMAGEAAATYASRNNIVIPYAMQPEPETIQQPARLSEMYSYRRMFKPSQTVLHPEPHFGLGLPLYARATSPLRRYADLVVHQQLRAQVTGNTPLDQETVALHISSLDGASRNIRRAERLSNMHWKMVYLAGNPEWQGEAIVMAMDERKAVVSIPALALETRIRLQEGFEPDKTIRLAVREVDIPGQTAYFRVLKA